MLGFIGCVYWLPLMVCVKVLNCYLVSNCVIVTCGSLALLAWLIWLPDCDVGLLVCIGCQWVFRLLFAFIGCLLLRVVVDLRFILFVVANAVIHVYCLHFELALIRYGFYECILWCLSWTGSLCLFICFDFVSFLICLGFGVLIWCLWAAWVFLLGLCVDKLLSLYFG